MPADMVEIRNELEICVEKVVSAIEKLLEDERELDGRWQNSILRRLWESKGLPCII